MAKSQLVAPLQDNNVFVRQKMAVNPYRVLWLGGLKAVFESAGTIFYRDDGVLLAHIHVYLAVLVAYLHLGMARLCLAADGIFALVKRELLFAEIQRADGAVHRAGINLCSSIVAIRLLVLPEGLLLIDSHFGAESTDGAGEHLVADAGSITNSKQAPAVGAYYF